MGILIVHSYLTQSLWSIFILSTLHNLIVCTQTLIQSQIIMQKCKKKKKDCMNIFFYLQVKKLKDLEREKDLLWMGLQALEQVRESLCLKLEDYSSKKEMRKGDTPTLLLAQIHRVNRALRNLLCNCRNPINPAQGRPSIEGYVP